MSVTLRKLYRADGPYPLGKYSTLRDEFLHGMCADDWADESDGSVDSPTGYFYLVCVSQAEMPEIVNAFGTAPHGSAGNFVVRETDQGFIYVDEYPSPSAAAVAYADLEQAYGEYLDMGESNV